MLGPPHHPELAPELTVGEMDRPRLERAVHEILAAIGEDPERDGLRETPARVAQAYEAIFSGVAEDPARYLEEAFEGEYRDMVLIRDIPLYSMCVPGRQKVNAVSGSKRAAWTKIGDELWTLDKGFLAKTRVTGITSHKSYGVVLVRTSGGSFKVTRDHPVRTKNGWCEAGDLLPGDCVEWFPPRKLCREMPRVMPGYWLGYLLGAVASDGSIQDERRISVVVSNHGFAGRIAKAWWEVFSIQARVESIMVDSGYLARKIPMCRVRVVSSYAAEKLSGWLGLFPKCRDKTRGFHFPKVVTNSQEMTQGFLDGYIDGDGSDFGPGKMIVTANGVFARELAEYLQIPVGSVSGGLNSIYVSSRWHKPGWHGKHGFRQQSNWCIPQDSRYVKVEAVEPTPKSTKPHTVYSFKCEPYPTFLIAGHLTHNCEHHLVPIVGKAHVGYMPDGKVIGLSEIANIVETYARRPQIQERLTAQVADLLHDGLGSRGSMVVIEAEQLCMTLLGSQKPGSITVTSATRGVFDEDDGKRAEFMGLITKPGG